MGLAMFDTKTVWPTGISFPSSLIWQRMINAKPSQVPLMKEESSVDIDQGKLEVMLQVKMRLTIVENQW